MKSILIILFSFINIICFSQANDNKPRVFNVKMFGAKGDGSTNDTRAIQLAINTCNSAGGGIVYFPNGIYIIADTIVTASNSQLTIPGVSQADTNRKNITLRGESYPNLLAVGFSIDPLKKGVILKSTLATFTTSGQAVIAMTGSPFRGDFLTVENIAIEVKNNPASTGPVVGGINAHSASSLTVRSFCYFIDTTILLSHLPSNDISGIETPDNGGEVTTLLEQTYVTGAKNGYKISEHVVLNQAYANACYYGFYFKGGSNSSASVLSGSFYCPYDIYIAGSTASTFANFNIAPAWQQSGKWYDNIATIKDSSNLAYGQIYYTFDAGLNANFVKSGGANLHCLTNAEGVASYINGMKIGNTITSATTGSVLYATTSSGLAQDNSHFFWDATNHRLGIGNTAPTSDVDVGGTAFPILSMNTNSSTGTPIVKFKRTGTSKFSLAMDANSNGTNDFTIADDANSKSRFYISSTGATSIGGDAILSPGIKITSTGITNLFKGADVASASTITPTGNLFHVTGTTNITTISGTGITAGTTITIIFDGILTLTDGSNIKMAGNFTTAADATWTGVFDGTFWYEKSRSTN